MPYFTLLGESCSRLSQKWPKYGPFMAKIWSSHGPSNWFFLSLNQCVHGYSMPNFSSGCILQPPFQERPKYDPFMAKTWSLHGFSNWFLLNLDQCTQGCSMPNFTLLGVFFSPLFPEMTKIWPFYGSNIGLTGSFKLVHPESQSMCSGILCQISESQVYPVAQLPRNGQNMPLLWPKYGPHMVLQIVSF